jgi:hypothetical protein
MTALPLAHAHPLPQQLEPEHAWKLLNALHALCDVLWDAYEYEFLEFCAEATGNHTAVQPGESIELPF